MAIAENLLNKKYGSIINHKTYVIAGDGCLMEGISHEAISIAGHIKLKNLIVFLMIIKYQLMDQQILHAQMIKKKIYCIQLEYNKSNGHSFENIEAAIKDATKSSKPTLILCKTTIGFGSPNKSGKETAHGSPLELMKLS